MSEEMKALLDQAKTLPATDAFKDLVAAIESNPELNLPKPIRIQLWDALGDAAMVEREKLPPGMMDHHVMRLLLLEELFVGKENQ